MANKRTELVKGTVDLLILRTLALQPMHGAAIADRVLQITQGTFELKAGSLFPALHRLEHEGWIAGEWQTSGEGRRVKSYAITRAGQRQLKLEKETWDRVVLAMTQVLES